MRRIFLIIALCLSVCTYATPAEHAAKALAKRLVPEYAGKIIFKEVPDTVESYSIEARGRRVLIKGTGANAMAAGLGHYLRNVCGVDVSWERAHAVDVPASLPLPDSTIKSRALVPQRFFLNYCTYGYAMPWWKWEDWERFIDWMALQGINMPLALTGQESVLQELWRKYGLTDDEIRAWFTGPAHLPWHRMCNIDGVDGPLPQSWIDGQEKLQKLILKRERSLGMKPVLPAFCGHVPEGIKVLHPEADITDISGWAGFPPENLPHFMSPRDDLFAQIQKDYLEIQTRKYGSNHIYGFDLFNEVDPPSWDPETLASISRKAYESIAETDSEAVWLQMGWMFWYDRKHWTPEIVKAYLEAVPQGKVTILDYYTETMPVWTRTEAFYGQPYIFCYLGNFGGNTRLAVPFRTESGRITEALEKGKADGIGCTLEGFGINRWPYEYVMSRAWEGTTDDGWLESLDRRRSSPDGFWKEMADDVLTRPAISRGPLVCVRPRMSDGSSSSLGTAADIDNPSLVAAWKMLLDAPSGCPAWSYDAVAFGSQALAYHFASLWEEFCKAYRSHDEARAAATASRMQELLADIDLLLSYEPSFRLDRWLDAAGKWGRTPEERQYYRHNAFLLITRWGDPSRLGDYACRLWNGLVSTYYATRWKAFTDEVLTCIREGREYDKDAMNARLDLLEKDVVDTVPELALQVLEAALPDLCNSLYRKWFDHSFMSYTVGVFSKYSEDSTAQVAALIKASGASLVALNELDSCNRRHNVYQLKELAEALGGWDYHFASAFPFAGGAYGNGVVSQEPIIARHSIALPRFDGAEPRSCAVVETEHCVFASVHLDYTGATARLEQARTLNDWFTEHYSGFSKPVLLCGDMNSTPDFEAITELLKCWEPLSGTGATYPSGEPQKCIDYIFAFKAAAPVKKQSSEVYKAAGDASDHLPVIVRFL